MERFFNDEIDFEELNLKVYDLGLLDYRMFKKEKNLDTLFGD